MFLTTIRVRRLRKRTTDDLAARGELTLTDDGRIPTQYDFAVKRDECVEVLAHGGVVAIVSLSSGLPQAESVLWCDDQLLWCDDQLEYIEHAVIARLAASAYALMTAAKSSGLCEPDRVTTAGGVFVADEREAA